MTTAAAALRSQITPPRIAADWLGANLDLYLGRCQVDTPDPLVRRTWDEVARRRPNVGTVVDFGAGDGRFARSGRFERYLGYEIDLARCSTAPLPLGAEIIHRCAFAEEVGGADVAIGNPPFVRNQDLPEGWRLKVAEKLERRSGVRLSGLANAWQYFFLLSILSVGEAGLCALVIPYEWVSRPSAEAIRKYIRDNGWSVDVHRIEEATFGGVLTTASITIVDKRERGGRWRYFVEDDDQWRELPSPTASADGHLAYRRAGRSDVDVQPNATRGLSPGSQKIFTLTEGERARLGLKPGVDVVPCVTSLRHSPEGRMELDEKAFNETYRFAGQRCWLLRTDREPGDRLRDYLDAVPKSVYATSTCLDRPIWWKYKMPAIPEILIATCFKGSAPKVCVNTAGVTAVGGVAGIRGTGDRTVAIAAALAGLDLRDKVVSHANHLRKVEINQLNSILAELA